MANPLLWATNLWVNDGSADPPQGTQLVKRLASLLTSGTPDVDSTGHFPVSVQRQPVQERIAFRRTGSLAETMSRVDGTSALVALNTSRLFLFGIYLLKGTVVTNIGFTTSTTAGASLTHTWFSLWDASFARLGLTADDTSAAWASHTEKVLALTSPYTVLADGIFYLGITTTGTTQPTLMGKTLTSGSGLRTPILCGTTSATYTTGPGSAPSTAPTPDTSQTFDGYAYAFVS